jgi:tetratricopeptide (TPR) repeat protein
MQTGDPGASPQQLEQAWLSWLQTQCNSVSGRCQLPRDRAATRAELDAFFAGLVEMENVCTQADIAAQQLEAAGFGAVQQRLAAIRKDVQGARDAFKQPASKQPGPLTARMRELRNEQRNLDAFTTDAAGLVMQDANRATEALQQAAERYERLFDELAAILPKLPNAEEEMPLLQLDRQVTKSQLQMFLGLACQRLFDLDAAQKHYEQALRDLPPNHAQRSNIELSLLQLQNFRMVRDGR